MALSPWQHLMTGTDEFTLELIDSAKSTSNIERVQVRGDSIAL